MPNTLFFLFIVPSVYFCCTYHTMKNMNLPRQGRQLLRDARYRCNLTGLWGARRALVCSLSAVEWMPSIFPYCTRGRGRLLSFSNMQFSPVIVPVARCLSDSQWSYLIDPCTSLVGLLQSHFTRKASLKDQTSHQSVTENCAINVNNFTAVCIFYIYIHVCFFSIYHLIPLYCCESHAVRAF